LAKPHAVCEVELLTQGPVEFGDREHATGKVRELCELGHEPVLTAVVKLRLREDAADSLPAIAEATIDMNGVAIRAHASGDTMTEAIDRLDERLGRRLRRRRKRLEDRRHDREPEPTRSHPGYASIPRDEREVVRHKSLAMHPMTVEEAVDEMDLLDHGFYLYLDTDHDIDRVVFHNGDGTIHVVPSVVGEDLPGDTRPPIHPAPTVLNHLPLVEAEVLLDEGDEPFVFFAEPDSGRGQVLYRRFDGHYGLISPAI
tara:strand:+ start:202 stop:969 length:768 start_codon:yes stop_codon:yes gene_type:complete